MKKLLLSIAFAFAFCVMQAKAQISEFLRFEKEVYIFEDNKLFEVTLSNYKVTADSIYIKGTFQKQYEILPNEMVKQTTLKTAPFQKTIHINSLYVNVSNDIKRVVCLPCYLNLPICDPPTDPFEVAKK